ncbi:MAG: flagellar export chaperone FliS [Planctomycetes bacterium]|nr:flagellar export chaperone FliS [Planctomycetota bacterium]MBI3835435.1 flagellar export chaperone FliS [Planctomycetota bacterium]
MSTNSQTENAYLRDAILTAAPEQLQLMLYDGAIRFCLQARDAIEGKDYEESFNKLTRAQNIILEMQNGLNYEVNRELCGRVASIYNYLYRRLVDANLHRDVAAIDESLKILRIERETWQILVDKIRAVRESGQDMTSFGSSGNNKSPQNPTVAQGICIEC